MKLRTLARIQIGLGVVLLAAGGALAIIYARAADRVTANTADTVRGFARQLDLTAQMVQGESVVFDQTDQTLASYGELVQTVKSSADEIGRQTSAWRQAGADANRTAGSVADRIRGIGEALDIPIPYGISVDWGIWAHIPYPKDVSPKYSDRLQKQARTLMEASKSVQSTGDTIQKTIETTASKYERTEAALTKAADSSLSSLGAVREVTKNLRSTRLPSLVKEMKEADQRLTHVADDLQMIGPLLIGAGCLAVGAGIVCFVNGLAVVGIDRRLRDLEASPLSGEGKWGTGGRQVAVLDSRD